MDEGCHGGFSMQGSRVVVRIIFVNMCGEQARWRLRPGRRWVACRGRLQCTARCCRACRDSTADRGNHSTATRRTGCQRRSNTAGRARRKSGQAAAARQCRRLCTARRRRAAAAQRARHRRSLRTGVECGCWQGSGLASGLQRRQHPRDGGAGGRQPPANRAGMLGRRWLRPCASNKLTLQSCSNSKLTRGWQTSIQRGSCRR
mmetsp:Transcript_148539/g.276662  ORF Transcript_148539/g.276662 Transcript_148539/m.276662 type:complete len:203 (-) Transcript_148539:824-1432(-)